MPSSQAKAKIQNVRSWLLRKNNLNWIFLKEAMIILCLAMTCAAVCLGAEYDRHRAGRRVPAFSGHLWQFYANDEREEYDRWVLEKGR